MRYTKRLIKCTHWATMPMQLTPIIRPLPPFRVLLFALIVFIIRPDARAQTNWTTTGNSTGSTDFLGTTSNQPLLFKANNTSVGRFNTNGTFTLLTYTGTGSAVAILGSGGQIARLNFSGSSTDMLTGAGTFASSNWKLSGNHVYNLNSGNVGIGTITPTEKLDVAGNLKVSGIVSAYGLNIQQSMVADTVKSNLLNVSGKLMVNDRILTARIAPLPGDSLIRLGDSTIFVNTNFNTVSWTTTSANRLGFGIGNGQTYAKGLNSIALGFRAFSLGSTSFTFGSYVNTSLGSSNAMTIGSGIAASQTYLMNNISNSLMIGFNSNLPTLFVGAASGSGTIGKVGIGTSAPDAMLQIGAGMNRITAGDATTGSPAYTTAFIGFNVGHPANGQWTTNTDNSNNGGVALLADVSGALRFVNVKTSGGSAQSLNNTQLLAKTKMKIGADGRVEIGTGISGGTYNDSLTKLTVCGRIMAKDIVVSLVDWPDYVFGEQYQLRSLDELNRFVNTEHHLPGIASAATVTTNGLSVADQSKALTEKIEELTLYVLQLHERMKTLEAENAALKQNEQH